MENIIRYMITFWIGYMIIVPPQRSSKITDFEFKRFFGSPYPTENIKIYTDYRVKRLKGMHVPRLEDISNLTPMNTVIERTGPLSSEGEKKEIPPDVNTKTKQRGLIYPSDTNEEDTNTQESSAVPINDDKSLPTSPPGPINTPVPPTNIRVVP